MISEPPVYSGMILMTDFVQIFTFKIPASLHSFRKRLNVWHQHSLPSTFSPKFERLSRFLGYTLIDSLLTSHSNIGKSKKLAKKAGDEVTRLVQA